MFLVKSSFSSSFEILIYISRKLIYFLNAISSVYNSLFISFLKGLKEFLD